jgi:hypothetical protein
VKSTFGNQLTLSHLTDTGIAAAVRTAAKPHRRSGLGDGARVSDDDGFWGIAVGLAAFCLEIFDAAHAVMTEI